MGSNEEDEDMGNKLFTTVMTLAFLPTAFRGFLWLLFTVGALGYVAYVCCLGGSTN